MESQRNGSHKPNLLRTMQQQPPAMIESIRFTGSEMDNLVLRKRIDDSLTCRWTIRHTERSKSDRTCTKKIVVVQNIDSKHKVRRLKQIVLPLTKMSGYQLERSLKTSPSVCDNTFSKQLLNLQQEKQINVFMYLDREENAPKSPQQVVTRGHVEDIKRDDQNDHSGEIQNNL